MANCLEITLWYPEDKFNALSTALEPAGSSVEEELGRVLTELYERLVPSEQRVEIAEKLAREEQHEAEERVRHEAETYRVSVLKLTAGRACEYHKLTRAWDLLALAAFIRETVRKSPSSPSGDFRSRLGETERLSTQDFAELSMVPSRSIFPPEGFPLSCPARAGGAMRSKTSPPLFTKRGGKAACPSWKGFTDSSTL